MGGLNGWLNRFRSVSKNDTSVLFESALEGDLEADQNLTRVVVRQKHFCSSSVRLMDQVNWE